MFAVRVTTAHDKGNVFAMLLVLAHGKGNDQPNMGNVRCEKQCLPCGKEEMHDKLFFYWVFFFAVRSAKYARQSSSLSCARKNEHGKDRNARQTSIFP
jgi:hypothetical protein